MSHCPYAPSSGAQVRGLHIGRLLQECGRVQLVLLQKSKLQPDALAKTGEEFPSHTVMQLQPTPIRGLWERVRHELDPSYLNTYGWQIGGEDALRLQELAAAHDVVWIHGIYTANSVPFERWPKSVMDLDDVLSDYHFLALKNATSWKSRFLSARQFMLWKRREAMLFNRFDLLAVCSEADKRCLGASDRIHVVPNGYGMTPVEPKRSPSAPPRLGFIGTPNYYPNQDGIVWFIERVWPAIKKAHPTARLRLVGAGTDSKLSGLGPDIDGLGWVEDVAAEMATWSLSVVPIRIGGGTRIKTAESFSRKCPVVSTSLGVFGYDVQSGHECLLADEASAFAQACSHILRCPQFGEQLAQCAWSKYVRCWSWSAIKPRVEAAVEHCLSVNRAQQSEEVLCNYQTS